MAGGSFKSQNKVRPGAYINFKGVAKPLSKLGSRGVMTMPVAMGWGAQITELLSADLLDGKSDAKIGYNAFDEGSQIFREALKGCYKAIIFRLDTGGVKATKAIGGITVTAKYAGVLGNKITVKVKAKEAKFEVTTSYAGIERDVQVAAVVADLKPNDWVEFSGVSTITVAVETALADGANGTVDSASYATYLGLIKSYKWNTMAIPQDASSETANVITFIRQLREEFGKKVQAVLYNVGTNYEGIISVSQGYKTATEVISPVTMVATVAGFTAGANIDESNTYKVIEGATSIVYPVGVEPYGDAEIEEALKLGKFILSTRQDGVVVVEQDINTLHEFTPENGYAFSKNRVIRTLDEINNSIALLFEKSYIGKVDNDDDGRSVFKGDVIAYLTMLAGLSAIQNFDSSTDIDVIAGTDIDSIVVNLAVQPVDSMEKLYMTVLVG